MQPQLGGLNATTFASVTAVQVATYSGGWVSLNTGANFTTTCPNKSAAIFPFAYNDDRTKLLMQLALSSLHGKKRVSITLTGTCSGGGYPFLDSITVLQ